MTQEIGGSEEGGWHPNGDGEEGEGDDVDPDVA